MAAKIIGTVDGYGPADQLRGWVRHDNSDLDCPVHIRVFFEKSLIGEGRADILRPQRRGSYGFHLKLDRRIDAESIGYGRVQVQATSEAGTFSLPFYAKLLERLKQRPGLAAEPKTAPKAIAAGTGSDTVSDAKLLQLLQDYASQNGEGFRRRLAECLPYLANDPSEPTLPGAPTNELSMFGLMPGLKSPNKIALVGRNGFLFLLGGSNDLFGQHQLKADAEEVVAKAQGWTNLFLERTRKFTERGCRYIQMIVPEKTSVLPEFFPVPIQHPTPVLSCLERNIESNPEVCADYVNCLSAMWSDPRREEIFRKLDSHMGVYGTSVIFKEMLKRIGYEIDLSLVLDRTAIHSSDLGKHFFGVPLRERVFFPKADQFAELEAGLVKLEDYRPADGKHIGSRCVWANSSSALPLRVVVFGNSFFERGANAGGLSWWGARWFREFHFLWYPEIDYDYVDRVKPDVVICQTIERFLPVLPAT